MLQQFSDGPFCETHFMNTEPLSWTTSNHWIFGPTPSNKEIKPPLITLKKFRVGALVQSLSDFAPSLHTHPQLHLNNLKWYEFLENKIWQELYFFLNWNQEPSNTAMADILTSIFLDWCAKIELSCYSEHLKQGGHQKIIVDLFILGQNV